MAFRSALSLGLVDGLQQLVIVQHLIGLPHPVIPPFCCLFREPSLPHQPLVMTEFNHWLPSASPGTPAPACLRAVVHGSPRPAHTPHPKTLSKLLVLGEPARHVREVHTKRSFCLRCDRSGRDAGRAAVLGRGDKCSFGCRSGEWSQIIRPAP